MYVIESLESPAIDLRCYKITCLTSFFIYPFINVINYWDRNSRPDLLEIKDILKLFIVIKKYHFKLYKQKGEWDFNASYFVISPI